MVGKATTGEGIKEQVDAMQQKEALLKAHVEPWIDEAFLITVDIEGKLA